MTDEIIKMAREAGLVVDANQSGFDDLERFFHMAQAAEREACAKICENYADTDSYQDETSGGITTNFHAKLIRARGQA